MMKKRYIFGSLTRISDLDTASFAVHPLKRDRWATGDYVVGRFIGEVGGSCDDHIELTTGRLARMMKGGLLVGALGDRQATSEAVGGWRSIGPDGRMEDIVGGGLFGRETSRSASIPPSPPFQYQGHVIRDGRKVCMKDFVQSNKIGGTNHHHSRTYNCPTILIIGASMSCGKTTAARVIIHSLKDMGVKKVVGTKLAGAGYYHDILSMHDAGADAVFDFVDSGLPSSVVPPEEYREALQILMSKIASEADPDIVVAEAGASPFEPYNGSIAIQEMTKKNNVQFVVLCASDPYSVVGLIRDFGVPKPDLVSGLVTATSAGVKLVKQFTGLPALSLCTEESVDELKTLLYAALNQQLS